MNWIDGLKGLSALIVVFHHLCLTFMGTDTFFAQYPSFVPVARNFVNGNFAVHIFIILSSYLLFCKLSSAQDLLEIYKATIVKRYFRIMFSVGFVILLMYLFYYSGCFYAEEYGLLTHNKWLVGQHAPLSKLPMYILQCPIGFTSPVLNVGWMLGFIYFGNILAVIMDIIFRNKKIYSVLLLTLVLTLVIKRNFSFYYYNVVFAYMLAYMDKKKDSILGGVENIFTLRYL